MKIHPEVQRQLDALSERVSAVATENAALRGDVPDVSREEVENEHRRLEEISVQYNETAMEAVEEARAESRRGLSRLGSMLDESDGFNQEEREELAVEFADDLRSSEVRSLERLQGLLSMLEVVVDVRGSDGELIKRRVPAIPCLHANTQALIELAVLWDRRAEASEDMLRRHEIALQLLADPHGSREA